MGDESASPLHPPSHTTLRDSGTKTSLFCGNEERLIHAAIPNTTNGLSLEQRAYTRDILRGVDPFELLVREQVRKRFRPVREQGAQVMHGAVRNAHRTLLRHSADVAKKGRCSRP